ncbi:competence type IV pilus minor pilin ComGD [Candidatus Enterococcus mansonii]|uniref:Competence protein ComGD n=1 Tax=Candidatus Enterococcus mansonii TaxID=1834181 RepID=A0A242CJ92_9ENTE|nr:competence type IV pilus minor pilin ComGD [Enterococcus sp. 4G2_DIV0659]OTO09852.1 hypothetical protein A5880_000535 [Enterococcus sp. 4G2_DIV0659]
MPTLAIQRWKQAIETEQFLATFEKKLLFTQQMAIVNSNNTEIIFQEQEQKINFLILGFEEEVSENSLTIPDSLQGTGPNKIIFKKDTGNNGNLSKYSFLWSAKRQLIEFQFQLGSGRYVKKIKKT